MAGLMIGLSCRNNSLSPFDIVPIGEKNVIKVLILLLAAVMICFLAACGNSSSQGETTQSTDNASASTQEQAETTVTADTASTGESAETASAIGTVANTLAEDEDTLIATYADKFEQKTYSDSEAAFPSPTTCICPKATMRPVLIRWWSSSAIPAVPEVMLRYP